MRQNERIRLKREHGKEKGHWAMGSAVVVLKRRSENTLISNLIALQSVGCGAAQ